MDQFIAFDVETANTKRTSICSIGAVRVESGCIVDRIHVLVRPTPNYYLAKFTGIHGLSREDTDPHPHFPVVWARIKDRLEGLPFVAHNAHFDRGCLTDTLRHYGLSPWPQPFFCTLAASRMYFGGTLPNHRLPTVAKACGFSLEHHHDALADAEACAAIAIKLFSQIDVSSI